MPDSNKRLFCLDLSAEMSGVILSAGYDDSNIRVFNSRNLRMDTIYKGHEDSVLDIIYDPNNKSLLSCSADKSFRIWQ